MGFFVVGGIKGHDIRVAPNHHDILIVIFELWVVLQPCAPVLRTSLNLVEITIDPESAVEKGRLSITVNHDARPASLVPTITTIPPHEGLSAENLVFRALNGFDDLGLAIAVDGGDEE